MARKNKAALELLPPAREDTRAMIARLVEERISEIMENKDGADGADLEPFFRPKKVSYEMRRRMTVAEQNRWSYYYEDNGCLICATTDVPHVSLGMCQKCLSRTRERLEASIRKRHSGDEPETFHDTADLAREALLPSITALARKRGQ